MIIAFRVLVLATVAMLILGAIVPRETSSALQEADLEALSDAGLDAYESMLNSHLRALALTLVLLGASILGLWLFWRPARILFIVANLFVFATTRLPFCDVGPEWWRWALEIAGVIVPLATILLMYTSPVKERFIEKGPSRTTP